MSKTVPGRKLIAVTPSDTTVYNPPLRGLIVSTAGNLAIVAADDLVSPGTFAYVPGVLPVEVKRVLAATTCVVIGIL